jgi:hypothetical protein
MVYFAIYLTVMAAAVGGFALFAIVTFARTFGGRAWPLLAAGLLLVVGSVPPSILAVLWYARSADYRWAISGPGPFGQLGGGPAMMAAVLFTFTWTGLTWTSALWIAQKQIRIAAVSGDQSPPPSRR